MEIITTTNTYINDLHLVALKNFLKYPPNSGWQNKEYRPKDFINATGIGIYMLPQNELKEFFCIDIDTKPIEIVGKEKGYEKWNEVDKIVKDFIKTKPKGVYIEYSVSKGIHIFVRTKKLQFDDI